MTSIITWTIWLHIWCSAAAFDHPDWPFELMISSPASVVGKTSLWSTTLSFCLSTSLNGLGHSTRSDGCGLIVRWFHCLIELVGTIDDFFIYASFRFKDLATEPIRFNILIDEILFFRCSLSVHCLWMIWWRQWTSPMVWNVRQTTSLRSTSTSESTWSCGMNRCQNIGCRGTVPLKRTRRFQWCVSSLVFGRWNLTSRTRLQGRCEWDWRQHVCFESQFAFTASTRNHVVQDDGIIQVFEGSTWRNQTTEGGGFCTQDSRGFQWRQRRRWRQKTSKTMTALKTMKIE